ncbi:sigma 54-interacting transcriptional regulator [Fusibacter paucivorans]|uniref:Sigma 54-interacting transcriptional regulator n=1 Tax=Fusibacter paucivorans TaxID=76009 RepID=A0ABS5PNJ1_9FIRM|nr:sigma 54-interacting transcriptional regulator [Fusibacter paucivorans]MBS7526739.1 sigma 54-interacting transcriptional regulator [Fusibacter paucivorans]
MSLSPDIMKMILDHSYDGVTYTDENGNICYVNDAYSQITGLSKTFIMSNDLDSLLKKHYPIARLFQKIFVDRVSNTEVIQYINGGGNDILVTGIPIFDDNNTFKGVIGNIRDITDLNRLKNELNVIHQEYEKALDDQKRANALLKQKLDQLIKEKKNLNINGSDKTKQWMLELGERIAHIDSTVLITGESGVGKDVFANLVHQLDDDSKPFVKISCGAIPATLLESELFGYEAGAFTGASKQGKPGIFELAKDGTVFLDEVGELPLSLQVKLLTVLQDRKFYRIGGIKEKELNARVIAATNRDLKAEVDAKRFRMDLYYRLNVIPIHIPPLRERIEDIVPIAIGMLEKLNHKNGTYKKFSWEVQNFIMQYPWPGNIRELGNVVERLYVFSPNEWILPEYLPDDLLRDHKHDNACEHEGMTLRELTETVERDTILRYLKTRMTLNEIAEKLDISISTLVRKIQKYNLRQSQIKTF